MPFHHKMISSWDAFLFLRLKHNVPQFVLKTFLKSNFLILNHVLQWYKHDFIYESISTKNNNIHKQSNYASYYVHIYRYVPNRLKVQVIKFWKWSWTYQFGSLSEVLCIVCLILGNSLHFWIYIPSTYKMHQITCWHLLFFFKMAASIQDGRHWGLKYH